MAVKITVIGSMNMDMVTVAETMPKRGETIKGDSFTLIPGGKGANQAVAAARLGADVVILGCIGDDAFGQQVLANLHQQKVNTNHIRTIPNQTTGVAQITVTKNDNSIIVVPGANGDLQPDDLNKEEDRLAESDVVLIQLEIPMPTVMAAAQKAKEAGALVILNPAPYHTMPPELLAMVDYITPNEHECDYMLKRGITKDTAPKMIVTKGKTGTQYFDGEQRVTVPSYAVEVVDTTGAGDAFNGALAYALAAKKAIDEAVIIANAAGALSVTKFGAQNGLPTLGEVETFMKKKGLPIDM